LTLPVAFKVLGLVSPVAQAVGNTVKRVVILIATVSALFFDSCSLQHLGM
jgi:hypothetical protein